GKDEKEYWRWLKKLTGMKKKEEKLPEEVQLGERVERGERRKEVWMEAFRKLGKMDSDDKNFDEKEYVEIRGEVEQWEREGKGREESELDRDRNERGREGFREGGEQ